MPVQQAAQAQLYGERRIATVILADVRGSTDLMEQIGTEAWVGLMNRVFHVLEAEIYRYGGVVDQFRGDGLVAFFGTRVAHEDDPERAILAALAMQASVSRFAAQLASEQDVDLRLRVGVNTGEVIVARIGDRSQHSEDTAMGEAIALAARMEQAAEPGTVLVSENTYQLVESAFEWEPLGQIAVKGISQPVAVYRPAAPRADALRSLRLESMGLSPVLIGRDRELASLAQRLADLRRGRGGIVTIVGDEGIGKSYLLAQARRQMLRDEALLGGSQGKATQAITWLRGHCPSYAQSWPYSMWLDMLHRWMGVEDETREETTHRLKGATEELWGDLAQEYHPYLATLMALPLEDELAERVAHLDAETLRQGFYRTLRAWVHAIAERAPVVLSFDDMYWADATSLDLLESCVSLSDQVPVLFVLMFRLRRDSPVWAFHQRIGSQYPERLLSIRLERLSDAQAGEMVDQLIGTHALPAPVRDQVVRRAEGNPYYIEELVRMLIRDGVLVRDPEAGTWQLARVVSELDLPDTLRSLLLARIDALAPPERHVLQLAAVIGVVFWKSALQELVEDDLPLDRILLALQRDQLVQERGYVAELGTEYVFRSPLVRDLACESILSAQRARYARQVADHLSGLFGQEALAQYYDVVAYQYRCAGDRRRELFYTLAAAEYTEGIYAHHEALDHYSRAVELLDALGESGDEDLSNAGPSWRLEALKGAGRVLLALGRPEEAETHFRKALDLGSDSETPLEERLRIHYWLCEALFWAGRYEEQVALAERGLALLDDDGVSVERALMNQEIAIGYHAQGKQHKFLEYTRRTAAFLDQLPYSVELRPAYDHVATMYAIYDKDMDRALQWTAALREHAVSHQDLRALGEADAYTGLVRQLQGDLVSAARYYGLALARYEAIGDVDRHVSALRDLSAVHLSLGEMELARRYAERQLELVRVQGDRRRHAEAMWQLASVRIAEQEWEAAISLLDRAASLALASDASLLAAVIAFSQASAYLHQEDHARARLRCEEAMERAGVHVLGQDSRSLALVLNLLDYAYQEDRAGFAALCERWRAQIPDSPLSQWALAPSTPDAAPTGVTYETTFSDALDNGWAWEDPLGSASLTVQDRLCIAAPNGTDLWRGNVSAPRAHRLAHAPSVAEVVCERSLAGVPAVGGLLLWADGHNCLRLDWGTGGADMLLWMGTVDGQDLVFGRGWLREGAERAHLRLEWDGAQARALCSADGRTWYSLGEVAFAPQGRVVIGLYASGSIDRLIYPGAYPAGAAICFTRFRLWSSAGDDVPKGA